MRALKNTVGAAIKRLWSERSVLDPSSSLSSLLKFRKFGTCRTSLSRVITLANPAAAVAAARHFNKLFCFDALERLETALAGSLTYDQGKTQPTKGCSEI